MPAWSPRRARLVADAVAGSSSIQVTSSFDAPGLMRCGVDLVTVSGSAGVNQTWSVSPAFSQRHNAGGYLIETTIIATVNGVHHTGVMTDLRHREESPRGEIEASWTVHTKSPATYTPNMDGTPTTFLLSSNESGAFVPFFGGHIGRVEDKQDPNGYHHIRLYGRGNYITLDWNGYGTSFTWPPTTAGHTPITDAIALWCPYVSATTEHVLDGGLQIGQVLDGIGRSPMALINLITGRGDAGGVPLDWYVRTDPDGGQKFWLVIRSRQTVIDIPISSLEPPTFAKDYETCRNRVVIKYQGGYVDVTPAGGATGAIRWRYFDYSTQLDNEQDALQVANTYLNYWRTLEAISEGSVVLRWPNPIGGGIAHHRIRAGWLVNITGWGGAISLGTAQIKGVDVDHKEMKVSMSLGKLIEDEMTYADEFVGKSSKRLGSATSGLIPQNIAPPDNMPNQLSSPAVGYGAGGRLGWKSVAQDADIISPVYGINAGYDNTDPLAPIPLIITPGRKFPDFQVGIGGWLVGFKLVGNDGVLDTPGPGDIAISIGLGHFGDAPAKGTEIAKVSISGDVTGSTDLAPPTAPPATLQQVEVTPGDYLSFDVLGPDSTPAAVDPTLNNVAIMILIRRTNGSFRATTSGAPSILNATHGTDPDTGESVFTITTDRPAHVQVQFGQTTAYGGWSQVSEIGDTERELRVRPISSPFHWRVRAFDDDNHLTIGNDHSS